MCACVCVCCSKDGLQHHIDVCVLGCTAYKECVMPNQFMNGKNGEIKHNVSIMHVFCMSSVKTNISGTKQKKNVMHSKHDIAQMINSHSQNGYQISSTPDDLCVGATQSCRSQGVRHQGVCVCVCIYLWGESCDTGN